MSSFNPRPPRGGRPGPRRPRPRASRSFNPRPPRGGRLQLGGRDLPRARFNPRPPRGGRPERGRASASAPRFQPTPPAREATVSSSTKLAILMFQPTPPARGATRMLLDRLQHALVSTHAPRAGGDLSRSRCRVMSATFQPTPPARGRRHRGRRVAGALRVSTHAPRAGGDVGDRPRRHRVVVVSTHAPRAGGDFFAEGGAWLPSSFQPTPPARGATWGQDVILYSYRFQPTPPARGATRVLRQGRRRTAGGFNPRPPRGGRLDARGVLLSRRPVSTHAPRAGGDSARITHYCTDG